MLTVQIERGRTIRCIGGSERDLGDVQFIHEFDHSPDIGRPLDVGGLQVDDRETVFCQNGAQAALPGTERFRAYKRAFALGEGKAR